MSNAFPPHDGCPVPAIEAIGDIDVSCLVSDPPFPCLGLPIVPPPPSFDFGCYPLGIHVDWDPKPSDTPEFSAKVVYLGKDQTRYCKPQVRFRVRMGAAGCGNVSVMVLADHNIELTGCQDIDGIYVCTDDKVLTIAQDDPKENDVWIVQTGAWIRFSTVLICNSVIMQAGLKHARETWQIANEEEPVHEEDDIYWIPRDITSVTCRLRLTDTTIPLEEVQTVDGMETVEGDLIAVDFGSGTSTLDGIWLAKDELPWVQLYAVDPNVAPPGIPILSAGAIVTVYDGYSSPWMYVVGRNFYDPGP